MTPNLDAVCHWWVSALAWFNFELKHQKGNDNTVVDALSQVTTWLVPDTVMPILDGVTLGTTHEGEVHDPTSIEGDSCLKWEVCVTTGHALVQRHVTDWAEAQKEDPMLSTVLDWLKAQKKTDLKALLEEHTTSRRRPADLTELAEFHNSGPLGLWPLYLCLMPKGETADLLLFVVPSTHSVTTLNRCHRDVGHQGCDCTLSLFWEHFWWPGMANQMQQSIKSCTHCLQHDGDLSKVPLHLIVATAPMDLLHVEFTTVERTLGLNRLPTVTNVLVFQDHFMKHVMVHVTPNHTAKTIAKFLYQGYISIFWTLARLLSDWDANFMSSIINKICKLLGIRKLQTTPYCPQMNGLVKRSHQTIM